MANYFVDNTAGHNNNDGRDNVGFSLMVAEYSGAEGYLGQLGAFAAYTWHHGDVLFITGSSGGVLSPGLYEIDSRLNDHTIRLSASPTIAGCLGAPSGSDAGITSSSGAWADETRINSGLLPGDTVWIRATTTDYTTGLAPAVPGTAGAPIRIFGYTAYPGDGGRPVLRGMTHGINGSGSGDCILGCLDIHDTTNDGIMLTGGGPRWVLVNVDVSDSGAIGLEASGVYDVACIGCRIRGSASWGVYGYREFFMDGCDVRDNANGIHVGNGVIAGSLVRRNGGFQVRFTSSSAPGYVLRSTIDGGGSALGIDQQAGQEIYVSDSILTRCTEAIRAAGGGHRICRTKLWANAMDYDAAQVSEVVAAPAGDPRLRDVLNGDYRLMPGSPLIGAGMGGGNIGWDQAAAKVRARATSLGMQL